jgi:hypothetical protein
MRVPLLARLLSPVACKPSRLAWLVCGLLAAASARGDVIEMSDGRRFEGKVVGETQDEVTIDTKVGSIRVTIGLDPMKIKDMQKKPLPAGFFDPPPAEQPDAEPRSYKKGQAVYLEVPVIGQIGKDVRAEGIRRALSYARANGIAHVVFYIDSAGGDTDEASQLYRNIRSGREGLQLHGIIKKCQGAALAAGVWCNTVHFLPGSVLGGEVIAPGSKAKDARGAEGAGDDEEIFYSQLAYRVVTDTGKTGRGAAVVRALLDPAESLCAFKDEKGAVQLDQKPPAGVPKDRIIFATESGKVLQLGRDQAVALGLPALDGGATDLGGVLGISGWTSAGRYGADVMQRTALELEQKAKAAQTAFEQKVEKNVTRRQDTERYIEHNMKESAQWDPTKGKYETYASHYSWGWGAAAPTNSNRWTEDSRSRWATRSDACIAYLMNAGRGLEKMRALDAEAAKLGLDPTYKKGEIDLWQADLKQKISVLQAYRNREGQ